MKSKLKKVPARFYRTDAGGQPVRDWLQGLLKDDRKKIGADIATVEYGWPIGMPTCRPMGNGLHEVRTDLKQGRIARVLFCVHEDKMVLPHGLITKTENTPPDDVALARKRRKETTR